MAQNMSFLPEDYLEKKVHTRTNVLCLSLRATSEIVAKEILDAWFDAEPDASEAANVAKVDAMDAERT